MTMMTFRQAIREALREELRRDQRVFVFGEEVAGYGGSFKVTDGLLTEYGPERVIDTPISESALMGAAVGAALVGMRPVVEIMYADLITIGMDHLINSAAKVCYLHDGEASASLVLRSAFGPGRRMGAHHSQCPEMWFANVPGLVIVMPSTPRDAKGLLKSAIRCPNPVVFLERSLLYSRTGDVPDEEYTIPIGPADIKRTGSDVTVVATGLMVERSLAVASLLANEGVSVEVIDLRTILPLDERTVVNSVKKTGHLVIVNEAPTRYGIGGEIAAVVAEHAFGYLDAPIQRVGAPFAPIPLSPQLEDALMVSEEHIEEAIRRTINP